MLKTIDEIKDMEIETGAVVNGIDNPNMLSIDSTEPIQTTADDVGASGDEAEVEEKSEILDISAEKKVSTETEKTKEEEVVKVDGKPESKTESESDTPKVAKRIGDLTKKWRTAEREAEYEKQKRIEAEDKIKELVSKIPSEDRPLKADFDDEDDYIEALTDWKIDTKLKASQVAVTQEIEDKDERKAVTETYTGLDSAMSKGKEKYEDFDVLVLNEDLIISPELTQILLDTDIPEEIMYYLASNVEESSRISELDPVRIAKEIGKLEVQLAKEIESVAKGEEVVKPKSNSHKKQSNAPDPITPIKATGITEKDPSKMSPKEYREWREKSSK